MVAAPEMRWPLTYTWVHLFCKPEAFGFSQQQTLFRVNISLLLLKSERLEGLCVRESKLNID